MMTFIRDANEKVEAGIEIFRGQGVQKKKNRKQQVQRNTNLAYSKDGRQPIGLGNNEPVRK